MRERIRYIFVEKLHAFKVAAADKPTSLCQIRKMVLGQVLHIPYGSDKKAYEKRIEDIIKALHRNRNYQYYIAAFPFFNEKNAIVYNLIHCTSNIKGFRLYKQSAWQTFGGKSSTKNTHGLENQLKH